MSDDECMRLRYPPRAHAQTGLRTVCSADHGSQGWRAPAATELRLWRLVADAAVADVRHERADWALLPGTGLRLDAIRMTQVDYHDEGPQWQRGSYEVIERRFCVLEGSMAGTCWETWHERPIGSAEPYRGDRIESIELRNAGSPHLGG